jgi:ATP-binding cassette subfamily B protein
VARGALSVGALTTVIPLVLEVAGALGGLSRLHASLVHGADAARRLGALDAAPHSIEGPLTTAGAALGSVRGAVQFRDVRFAYPVRPDVSVLNGFSLSLAPGEVFALVGASGGGKSTVAALLTRFYDVGSGQITLDGVDVRNLDPRALRQAIGHVTQEPVLFSGTIGENIAFAHPGAPQAAVEAAARAANAHAFITALPLGYDTPVGERGAQLSGGQRQRIAVARVLLLQPRLLLLVRHRRVCMRERIMLMHRNAAQQDEATSALDSESERLVAEALQAASAERTCIIIAHRLSTGAAMRCADLPFRPSLTPHALHVPAVRRANRIGVMAGGKLVEVGTHEELLALRGAYWRLVQSAVFREDTAPAAA